jgi:ribosome biogenesis ATPase
VDEQLQYDGNPSARLSVPTVYDKIKRSNSSLNRKSKRLLEDSIERVLSVMREEESSSDLGSIDGEFDGVEISNSKVRS